MDRIHLGQSKEVAPCLRHRIHVPGRCLWKIHLVKSSLLPGSVLRIKLGTSAKYFPAKLELGLMNSKLRCIRAYDVRRKTPPY